MNNIHAYSTLKFFLFFRYCEHSNLSIIQIPRVIFRELSPSLRVLESSTGCLGSFTSPGRERRLLASPPKDTSWQSGVKRNCQSSKAKFHQQDSNPGPLCRQSYALSHSPIHPIGGDLYCKALETAQHVLN